MGRAMALSTRARWVLGIVGGLLAALIAVFLIWSGSTSARLKRRLADPQLPETEKKRLLERISQLEQEMGMD